MGIIAMQSESTDVRSLETEPLPSHAPSPQAQRFAEELSVSFVDCTPQQIQAVELLAQGQRLTNVAANLGIDRSTLYRWKTQHPPFIAALNRRHKESLDSLSVSVSHILRDAINEVGRSLKTKGTKERRLHSALAVIKTFGSRKLLQPLGPTSQPAALRHIALQRRAELCEPLTKPLSYGELGQVLDELQFELRDVVRTKYSTFDIDGQPTTPNPETPPVQEASTH